VWRAITDHHLTRHRQTSGDVSVRVLTIGRHVTKIRWFGGAGTAPTCLIPAWARIARFLVPRHRKGGRPCPPERWREYLDAMLYVLRTGCA
jgi:hypothetical protein